jgi:hypothetical protein
MKNLEPLRIFMVERERIRVKKEAGEPRPWTEDMILQHHFFCNLRREDDKVSKWIKINWRDPHENDPDLWFALLVARRGTNHTETLEELGYPVPWDPSKFKTILRDRKARGEKTLNTQAYQLVVPGHKGTQSQLLADIVLSPIWEQRINLRPVENEALASYHARLSKTKNIGPWFSSQIIADLKYTKWLRGARDWWTFVVPGPGSVRGLNRVNGLPWLTSMSTTKQGTRSKGGFWRMIDMTLAEQLQWANEVNQLRQELKLEKVLDAQDMQGCLCEFNRYEAIRLGELRKLRYYY